jgi:hypothetical protein
LFGGLDTLVVFLLAGVGSLATLIGGWVWGLFAMMWLVREQGVDRAVMERRSAVL